MPWVLENTGSFIFKKFDNTVYARFTQLIKFITQSYLSLLNSFLFSSRFSVFLKSLDNNFFRWFAYKSLLSRFSVLISYMWPSNHLSISSRFQCFSRSRFLGSGSRVWVQGPGPGFRNSPSEGETVYGSVFIHLNKY